MYNQPLARVSNDPVSKTWLRGPGPAAGEKRFLGFVETDTENEKVLTPFLRSLVERGLDVSQGLLLILDGGKGLRAAGRKAFRHRALVQRCQWHKRENVRGHAYCSARCRLLARRRSVQAAKARHQRSPEGRLDHRDHQRTYRTRCRVRDHSSPAVLRYARLHALEVPPAPAPEPTRCVVCGRVSRWLIPARWPRVDPRDGPEGPSTTGTWGNRGQARLRLALVIFRVVDDFAGFFFDSLTLSRLLRSAAIRSTTLAGASASWTTNSSPAILASITDRSSA